MKRLIFFLSLCCGLNAGAQYTEFSAYPNGLIYSEEAIGKLRHIVDSLNLKFKTCGPPKALWSLPQGKGHFLSIDGKTAERALADIKAGQNWQQLTSKYKKAVVRPDLVLLQERYQNYDDEWVVMLSGLTLSGSNNPEVVEKQEVAARLLKAGSWFWSFEEKTEWSEASLEAFWIIESPKAKELPGKYSEWIHYSECLIDTTSQVFRETAKASYRFSEESSKAERFMQYLDSVTGRPRFDYELAFSDLDTAVVSDSIRIPDFDQERFAEYARKDSLWQISFFEKVDALRNADPEFNKTLTEAYEEALSGGGYEDGFEALIGRYFSREEQLELKRRRRVVGGCSMDQRPRFHAQSIALLAAETTKWEIFLRCHLNIMNDRFDRVSDGSWAWKDRQTYIRELEVLDINVPDLILGTALRVENVSSNHYFSSINRIGRALSETKDPGMIEDRLLAMIADDSLDDFNRLLMYYVFHHYNYGLTEPDRQEANYERLMVAVATMPHSVTKGEGPADFRNR